jgi:CheY-like chemotaxis protein
MGTRKFLVVDDDCDDTELFAEAIGSLDVAVSCLNASDGKEALDKLKSNAFEKPDIIFLDINMPVMNGWEFLSRLKGSEGLKEIPVIMYSTSSKSSDIKTAMSSGALCFFTKPNSFLTLTNILRIVVEYMQKGNLDKVCDAIKNYRAQQA